MTSLYVFTAGNPTARDHLSKSIKNPISAAALGAVSTSSGRRLVQRLLDEHGELYAWGAEPGPKLEKWWEAMSQGDHVLTVYGSSYRFASSVIGKLNDEGLAEAIWGRNPDTGNTWQFIYFLSRPQPINVPVGEALPYLHDGYLGFTRIADGRLHRIENDYGSLEDFLTKVIGVRVAGDRLAGIEREVRAAAQELKSGGEFDPGNQEDGRKKTLQAIVRRQGQPEFRRQLLGAYEGKCAITGCDVIYALEAAHIVPYKGEHTNHPQNGLLLRGDIHTLFDYGLICVNPESMTVSLAPQLVGSHYDFLAGLPVSSPSNKSLRPSKDALNQQRLRCDWVNASHPIS